MNNIANINTNPSGYPKEEMMNNVANINTNPSSGYPKEVMIIKIYFAFTNKFSSCAKNRHTYT